MTIAAEINSVSELLPRDANEDSIALFFANLYGDELRFDHTRGKWNHWDGTRWAPEETQLAFDWARNMCRAFNKKHQDKSLPKMRTASAVEHYARADRRFAVTSELWNRDLYLLCTPGGTVDLRTGNMRENRPADHITKRTAVAPSNMSTPLWTSFLDQTTRGDDDLKLFLRQIVGYSLTGDTREHALVFIYGPGGNGKGVFVNTVRNLLGDYGISAPMDVFTASKYDRHPTELADLSAARLVTASETEEGRAWAESRLKQLTGGDPIKARFMRQDFFQFQPQFKLLFIGNHKPVLRNVTEAMRRRFHIIPFSFVPETKDTDLESKLALEYPGILSWALDGCADWQLNGLVVPKSVRDETAAYFESQDVFAHWVEQYTERKSNTTGETAARLFESWTSYAKSQGEEPGTQTSFGERMNRTGFASAKNTPGNHGKRGYLGLAIRSFGDGRKPYAD